MNTVKKSFLISGLVAVLAVSGTSAFAWGNSSKNDGNQEQRYSQNQNQSQGQRQGQMQQNGQRSDGKMAMRGAVNMEYIAGQLDLTDEQVTAVETIFSDFAEAQRAQMETQREAMRNSETRPSREDMQAMREAHRAAATVQLTDQLNTVLPVEVTDQLMAYVNAHSGMQHMRRQ